MPEIAALFASAKEQIVPLDGRIKGFIPEWLEGRLMRVGPGMFDLDENFTVNHYLDGLAMVCKAEIRHKKATYSQKLLDSEAYRKAVIAKKPVFAEFGTRAFPDPTKNIFSRVFSTLVPTDLTDNNVAALYSIENELIVANETCFVHSIDCDSLDKKERHDYMKLCGTMLMSAHPITDSEGTTWNIGSSILAGMKYLLVKIPAVGTGRASDALKDAKVVATIPSSWKTCITYFHTFSITENYVVFMEQPLLVNCIKMAQIGILGKSLKDTFEWTPSEKNRIYIIEKETGNIIKTKFVTDEPYFVFHNINAYEKEDQIIIDMVTYPSPLILEKLNLSTLRQNEFSSIDSSQAHRFVLPIISFVQDYPEGDNLVTLPDTTATAARNGDVVLLKPQAIADPGLELPTVNPRYIGRPYRYFYATGMYDSGVYKNSICKVDLETGEYVKYTTEAENEFCGEATFVPKPDPNTDEDDGVVMTPVSCGDVGKPDYLVILDGKTFNELARVEFDLKFAQTFHGHWIAPYK